MNVVSRDAVSRRCEALTASDRTVDCDIGLTLGAFDLRENKTYERWDYVDIRERGRESWPGHGGDQLIPDYTNSIDEAMKLRVNGYYVIAINEHRDTWLVTVGRRQRGLRNPKQIATEGKHLPAVLCAAWLLAGAA